MRGWRCLITSSEAPSFDEPPAFVNFFSILESIRSKEGGRTSMSRRLAPLFSDDPLITTPVSTI
jgi:hypothetical protein